MNVRYFGCLLLCLCSAFFAVPALAFTPTITAPPVAQPPLTTAGGLGVRGGFILTGPNGKVMYYNFASRSASAAFKTRLAVAMKGVRSANPYAVALLGGSAAVAAYFEANKYYFNESQYTLYAESIEEPIPGTLWQGTGGYSDVEGYTLALAADAVFSRFCANAVGSSTPCDATGYWRISDRSGNAECLASHTIGCYVRVELRRTASSSFNGQNIYLREFNSCPNGVYNPEIGGCLVSRPEAPVTDVELETSFANLNPAQQDALLAELVDYYPDDQFAYDYGLQPEFDPFPLSLEPWTETEVLPDGRTKVTTYTPDVMVEPYVMPDGKIGFRFSGGINERVNIDGLPVSDTDFPVGSGVPTAPSTSEYTCSNFQFICDFMDWFRGDPDLTEEAPELPVEEVAIESAEYPIYGGDASCPAPYPLQLSKFGTYAVSYQSFCDLAVTVKPLYLTLMSLFAALLVYRSMV